MYGWLLKALQDEIVSQYGRSAWDSVVELAGLEPEEFKFHSYYPGT